MSWEGHSQNFCVKGHFFEGNAGYNSEPTHCPYCGGKVELCHLVDDTNCDAVGEIIPAALATLLLEKEEVATCNLGHVHVTKHAVYRIPSREEIRKLESYWDHTVLEWLPCYEDAVDAIKKADGRKG